MSTETIVSIIVTAVISLIPFVVGFIDQKLFGTKVFPERESAERRMISDMIKSAELNYVGITHDKMTEFLDSAVKEGEELYWESINFYFPAAKYGLCWDEGFNEKMNLNILKISNYLMSRDVKDKLKTLKEVNFYLNACGFNIGGSFFRYRNKKHSKNTNKEHPNKSKYSYNVIYDVMQIVGRGQRQEHAKTIRLNHRFHKEFFQRLEGTFEEIKKGATLLYRIDASKPDLWNQSAASWDDYEGGSSSPHAQSMRYMLNEINKSKGQSILSLGAGTGKMEKLLISGNGYDGFIGLADKSYTMLNKAYDRMKNDKNVSYALIDLAVKDWPLYGALAGRKYDYILMHFSLHNFISEEQSLSDFAGRLKELLAYNGKTVVAIHDHVYDSADENELLRSRITKFAGSHDIGLKHADKTISLYDLKSEFFNNGLLAVKETERPIARNIGERVMMWKVDAILDTAINVAELNGRGLKATLFAELEGMEAADSKSMDVRYITFSEIIEVVSALIVNEEGEFLTVVKNRAYLLPGGEKLFGESDRETLKRELLEELRIDPDNIIIGRNLGRFDFEKAYLEKKPLRMHVYRCTLKQERLKPDNEISGYEWINLKKFTTYDNMPKEYFLKILDAAGILLK